MKRNTTIDVIKGAVMFNVVICHARWSEAQRLQLLFPFWIQMTIPTLMIISGYLSAKSFSKARANTLSEALNPTQLVSKLIRFAVPYTIVYLAEVIAHIVNKGSINIHEFVLSFSSSIFSFSCMRDIPPTLKPKR